MQKFSRICLTLIVTFTISLTGLATTSAAFNRQCIDNGDGTVTDSLTLLMWQKATDGPMDWDSAMRHAAGLWLGEYPNWRLPSTDELRGLYYSPCLNVIQVDYSERGYWSSSYIESDIALYFSFKTGRQSPYNKRDKLFVRAVRSGYSGRR